MRVSLANVLIVLLSCSIALACWKLAVRLEHGGLAVLSLVLIAASVGGGVGHAVTRSFRGTVCFSLAFGVLVVAVPVFWKIMFPVRF